jgi:hypothetical protein
MPKTNNPGGGTGSGSSLEAAAAAAGRDAARRYVAWLLANAPKPKRGR